MNLSYFIEFFRYSGGPPGACALRPERPPEAEAARPPAYLRRLASSSVLPPISRCSLESYPLASPASGRRRASAGRVVDPAPDAKRAVAGKRGGGFSESGRGGVVEKALLPLTPGRPARAVSRDAGKQPPCPILSGLLKNPPGGNDAPKSAPRCGKVVLRLAFDRHSGACRNPEPPAHDAYRFTRPISARVRAQVLERNGYTCQMCGAGPGDTDELNPARKVRLHIGHIRDKSHGGLDELSNLRALCSTCNQGAKNVVQEPPSHAWLLSQLRRTSVADQKAALDWLLRKFEPKE